MGSSYLIDTNAVIDLIGGQLPTSGELWLDNLIVTQDTYLSLINRIELLGFNGPKNEMAVLESFVSSVKVLPITDDIADKAIELRKIKKIKLPDALYRLGSGLGQMHGYSIYRPIIHRQQAA